MRKRKVYKWFLFGVLLFSGILFFLPVIFTVIGSFCLQGEWFLQGYLNLFQECVSFYRMFWNSVIYSTCITIGTIVLAIPAAYAFKFARFYGKNVFYVIYIILMLMPLQVMVLPNYIGLRDMKLLNTPFAIILPLLFSPMAVVVLHQYLKGCDEQIVEAARLETNSCIWIIWHCVVPQIKVCVFAVGLFVFSETWNMVEQPILYLDDDKWKNLSLMFSEADQYQAEVILPAAVVFMIPILLWYLLFRESLQSGLKR